MLHSVYILSYLQHTVCNYYKTLMKENFDKCINLGKIAKLKASNITFLSLVVPLCLSFLTNC